ncbi:MAG: HemK2/MTQ2 family protein methyltransferase [Bacteroidota bacterium]
MKSPLAILRPAYHFLAFNLLHRARLRRPVSTSVNGFEFVIRPSVMHPRIFKSGRIFAGYLSTLDLHGKDVLDLGTGSGVLALSAAAHGARVTATDINPQAVQCASENIRRNGFDSVIRALEGFLFDPLPGEVFDVIIFNPPYFDEPQNGSDNRALYGGRDLSVIREFSRQAAAFLKPGGSLLLIISSDADVERILGMFRESKFTAQRVHQHKTLFEEFFVYRFTPVARKDEILICPSCRGGLVESRRGWECKNESLFFETSEGIPDFVLPERRAILGQFLRTYQTVRRNERWGSHDLRYYHELPYRDVSGEHSRIWGIRAKSYECLIEHLTQDTHGQPQRILDVGAGNCWLSLRLARLGHSVTAVDPNMDPVDGLGVALRLQNHGHTWFRPMRAEFDYLPFADGSFDTIIFNASLHYAADPYETVRKMMPLLSQKGTIYVLDSPIYGDGESGDAMVEERIESFTRGEKESLTREFAGSYLTFTELEQLRETYDVDMYFPSYGLVWNLRPFLARVLGKRQPAAFALIRVRHMSVRDAD